jgi:putative MFS transporter
MAAIGSTDVRRNDDDDPAALLISGRIDRLPLTRVHWELAILVEITWGFIIVDTDGIGARLYPFVWRPMGVITNNQYAVIQALQVGLGVLLGTYLMSFVADKYGRRPAILLSTALAGLCLWPFAYVTDFVPLVIFSVLSTLGVGGIVATHAVYLSEMTSHSVRNRTMLTSQASTAIVGVFIALAASKMMPKEVGMWREFVWLGVAIQAFVLLPLQYFRLPESPRWLEARGRHDEADRVLAKLEARIASVVGRLPAADPTPRLVGRSGKRQMMEILTNPEYRWRSILILVCWLLAYPGIVYGPGAFLLVYMVDHGWGAEEVFQLSMFASLVTFCAFMFNAWLGERVERRDVLLTSAVLFAVAWVIMWIWPNVPGFIVGVCLYRIGTSLFLFNMYNYTAIAFPTRIRSVAFAWTDGLGHLGAWAGVTSLGPLYGMGPNHLGWILFIVVPGALVPGLLIKFFGIRQSERVLEEVAK